MLDCVGEFSFAVFWKASLASRFRLVASDVDQDTGLPTGRTKNAKANALVGGIGGSPLDQANLLSEFSIRASVVGDANVVILSDTLGNREWLIVNNSWVTRNGTDTEVRLPDNTVHRMKSRDRIYRVCRPHPNKAGWSVSPTLAALPALREIVAMDHVISAGARSRLAGNGLLLWPTEALQSMRISPRGEREGLPEAVVATGQGMQELLTDAMTRPIRDQTSAEGYVPIFVPLPADLIDKIKHLTVNGPLLEEAQNIRDKATRRLATDLSMPSEILLGVAGQVNHWNLWALERQASRWYTAPDIELFARRMNKVYLQPQLNDPSVTVWYAPRDPDDIAEDERMRDSFDRGVMNSDSFLRKMGAAPSVDGYDLDSDAGIQVWAKDQLMKDPANIAHVGKLIPGIARLLGSVDPGENEPTGVPQTIISQTNGNRRRETRQAPPEPVNPLSGV